MEVEHLQPVQTNVQNQQQEQHEAIVRHEQVVVQHVEMENIQVQRERQVVVIVRHEIIVHEER